MMRRHSILLVSILVAIHAIAANAQEFDLQPPGDREFVSDNARLLDQASVTQIRTVCDKLLTDKATPIIVVTIDSMAQHGGGNMPIETFAALLFNQWQVGQAKLEGSSVTLVAVVRHEIELAAIEEDACAIVVEVAKASGG